MRRSVMHTASMKLSGCRISSVSSKSSAPRARRLISSTHVAEYHIPPRKLSQTNSPSTGINVACATSPGIPRSLSAEVSWARRLICDDISWRSTEPSISSMTGIMETIINPIMERTPPNKRTVATAAETASSSLRMHPFIDSPPRAGCPLQSTMEGSVRRH